MKKTIFGLILSLLAVSCYEEVVIPVGDDEPVGVMNAQLNTLDFIHTVYLSVSQKSRVYALSGADVQVFLNGTLAVTAEECPPDYEGQWEAAYTFHFNRSIKPGDEVRIEARKGTMALSATVTVPAAVTIASIDTSSVRLTYLGETDTYLQAKMTFQDLPGSSFYRVSGWLVDDYTYLDEEGNPVPRYAGRSECSLWIETGFDPIISEGAGKTSGADLAALLSEGNTYSCFSDAPFIDQECTIRPLFHHYSFQFEDPFYGVYVPDWMEDDIDWETLSSMSRKVHRRAIVQLRSLDLSQYHYLKALENLDTFGTEMSFLVEPTTLPSNVEGGLGFVGFETVTEKTFYDCTRVLAPVDPLYY